MSDPLSGGMRLLDRVREIIRIKHYSIRTEQAYLQWIRRYSFPWPAGVRDCNTFIPEARMPLGTSIAPRQLFGTA